MMRSIQLLFIAVLGVHGNDATTVRWVPVSDGAVPVDDAFGPGGQTIGDSLNICRANTAAGPGGSGYLSPSLGGCVFAYKKTCHVNQTYDVLVASPSSELQWTQCDTNGEIPSNPVGDGYGNLLGRSEYSGMVYFGSVPPSIHHNQFCLREGQFKWKNKFDVLTCTPRPTRATAINITDVEYDLHGLNVTNVTDIMVVASDVTFLTGSLDDFNAEPIVRLPNEHKINRQWNVTSYTLPKGTPASIQAGVLGVTASGDFGITSPDDHYFQSAEMKERQSRDMGKQVSMTLGRQIQPGSSWSAVQTTITAQARLVTIPFKAILRQYYATSGELSDPIGVEGIYTDVQNYDVETTIGLP